MEHKGQIFIMDIFFVVFYYILLAYAWKSGLFDIMAEAIQGTDWEQIVPVIEIIVWVAPLIWLISKALWVRVVENV
jgi:hypothetical protein